MTCRDRLRAVGAIGGRGCGGQGGGGTPAWKRRLAVVETATRRRGNGDSPSWKRRLAVVETETRRRECGDSVLDGLAARAVAQCGHVVGGGARRLGRVGDHAEVAGAGFAAFVRV